MTEYQNPAVTADSIVFDPAGRVLLIRRKHPPFQGQHALPGGFLNYGESAEKAAARELFEETGLVAKSLKLVGVYSEPDRDPRQHVISIAYLVGVTHYNLQPGDDAADAEFVEYAAHRFDPEFALAFDHARILRDAKVMHIIEMATTRV